MASCCLWEQMLHKPRPPLLLGMFSFGLSGFGIGDASVIPCSPVCVVRVDRWHRVCLESRCLGCLRAVGGPTPIDSLANHINPTIRSTRTAQDFGDGYGGDQLGLSVLSRSRAVSA